MYFWEIATDSGRCFTVKGASRFEGLCNRTGKSAKQAALEALEPGERLAGWCRLNYIEPVPAYYGRPRRRGQRRRL